MYWEYQRDIVITDTTKIRPASVLEIDEALRQRGIEGWELVAALPQEQGDVMLIFKKKRVDRQKKRR
jgi:hypothetical protein